MHHAFIHFESIVFEADGFKQLFAHLTPLQTHHGIFAACKS